MKFVFFSGCTGLKSGALPLAVRSNTARRKAAALRCDGFEEHVKRLEGFASDFDQ